MTIVDQEKKITLTLTEDEMEDFQQTVDIFELYLNDLRRMVIKINYAWEKEHGKSEHLEGLREAAARHDKERERLWRRYTA